LAFKFFRVVIWFVCVTRVFSKRIANDT
jgi:hypothetical protein